MLGLFLSTRNRKLAAALSAVLLVTGAGAAWAQRDPAYAAARSAGQVGERIDGYLGIVGAAPPELRRLVDDINIKRRALYTERAQAANATVEEYAMTSGCRLILQTTAGEKYELPGGGWATRGAGLPTRDPRCA